MSELTRSDLLDLRTAIAFAELKVRQMSRSENRLRWTQAVRGAWRVTRRLTNAYISAEIDAARRRTATREP